jgi:glycerophosphoryl diester phosphodiesterase
MGCEWFIRAEVLKMAWVAGFDWIGFLHQQGAAVDGWTIDVSKAEQIHLAKVLVNLGIDELTTDAPGQLANLIDSDTII